MRVLIMVGGFRNAGSRLHTSNRREKDGERDVGEGEGEGERRGGGRRNTHTHTHAYVITLGYFGSCHFHLRETGTHAVDIFRIMEYLVEIQRAGGQEGEGGEQKRVTPATLRSIS